MTPSDLSQFNPSNEDVYLYGDPAIFTAMSLAATNELITELQARALDLTTDAASMTELRRRLDIPSEIGVGITILTTAQVEAAMPDGASFLTASPQSLGFCFSVGFENDGRDVLELFVAIDPARYPSGSAEAPSDDQIEAVLELNQFLITQLLIGLDGDESDEEPTDEAFEAMEDRAGQVLADMLDADLPPLLAVVPESASTV